jgi:hypothetical protein
VRNKLSGQTLTNLDNGIKLKIARRDNHHDLIRGREGIDGQPGERRGAINKNIIILVFDKVKLPCHLSILKEGC